MFMKSICVEKEKKMREKNRQWIVDRTTLLLVFGKGRKKIGLGQQY